MHPLAHKLITIYEKTEQTANTTIFGSVMTMPRSLVFRPPYRIAIYPCLSSTAPETAMGLFTALGYLLERWADVQVYRLFARLGDDDTYDWNIAQSQFDVEDWELDGLDDNIVVYGELMATPTGGWLLSVTIENDLIEDEDEAVMTFTRQAPDIAAFVAWLPELATQIADHIGAEQREQVGMVYQTEDSEAHPHLEALLKQAFAWERQLLFWLAGQAWDEDSPFTAHNALREAARQEKSDFAAWIVAHATSRIFVPGLFEIGEKLTNTASEVVAEHPQSRQPAIILAGGLYQAEQADAAYSLLQDEIAAHPEAVNVRLRLINLYKHSGRFYEGLAALQDAIRQGATNQRLYYLYGVEVQGAYENDSFEIPDMEFVLTDAIEDDAKALAREALAAYDAALNLDPLDQPTLYSLALLLKDVDTSRFWEIFKTLVEQDEKGDYVREVVESLYSLEDIDPALRLLEEKVDLHPERMDLQLNLASAYLVAEDYEAAQEALDEARGHTDDPALRSEIERMILTAHDPEFEQRFGDLEMTIGAGTAPSNEDVDFLEAAVERAPSFMQGYLLLANAYTLWEDNEAATEVLLDAQKVLGDNPDILEALAETLWNAGEQKLAFDYLNRGLREHPNHMGLLVRVGRHLFENEQLKQARVYLSRAETINPRDPFLTETRIFIANRVAEDPQRYGLTNEEDEVAETEDED